MFFSIASIALIRTRTEVRHNVALGNPEHANIQA
jgi:hypothetical protein